jgi:preprotein translocase subunit SecA
LDGLLNYYCPENAYPETWDLNGLRDTLAAKYSYRMAEIDPQKMSREEFREKLWESLKQSYDEKEQEISSDVMRHIEKVFMLQAVDHQWKDHLLAMDHLKEGIGLRGYGQKDPLIEYKKEGFDMFEEMKVRIVESTVENLFRIRAAAKSQSEEIERKQKRAVANLTFVGAGDAAAASAPQPVHVGQKVGRNDPCPCGSGLKYKKCHGK